MHARRQSIEHGGARPMSPRAAAWLAWSLGGLSLAMFVAIVGQYVLEPPRFPAAGAPSGT